MTRLEKTVRSRMERAIREFHMIQDGDRILVGVSGGADSLTLLELLRQRRVYVSEKTSTHIAHIDLGFESAEPKWIETLESHFQHTELPYHIIKTNISKHALAEGAKKNPCFICSLYRRRKIYELAHELKCNKIAYGHHKDDIIETLLINILFGRKIEAMHPIQEVFKGKMHIIRPLAFVDEDQLKRLADDKNLPAFPKICPVDGKTRRQKIKMMLATLQSDEKHANIRENVFRSLKHVHIDSSLKNTSFPS